MYRCAGTLIVLCCGPTVAFGQAPPFVDALRFVRFEMTKGGYEVTLGRQAAERLSNALEAIDDEDQIARAIRTSGTLETDPLKRAETEMIAAAVSAELPKFKQALSEKMGPEGVIIRVIGIETPPDRERPVLRRIGARLPEPVRERAQNLAKIARTIPIFWTVEPRE